VQEKAIMKSRIYTYRGLIDYKKSGGVVDVRCHDFLSPDEQQLLLQRHYQDAL
jgi:hypothetical protein